MPMKSTTLATRTSSLPPFGSAKDLEAPNRLKRTLSSRRAASPPHRFEAEQQSLTDVSPSLLSAEGVYQKLGLGLLQDPQKTALESPEDHVPCDDRTAHFGECLDALAALFSSTSALANIQYRTIDSPHALINVLDALQVPLNHSPSIYLDADGPRLGRHGKLSTISLYYTPTETIYLIDVLSLGDAMMDFRGRAGNSLRSMLESENITKIFFDGRSPADAFCGLYGVRLSCVVEIQLMEAATRRGNTRYLNGLTKCIEKCGGLSRGLRDAWVALKHLVRSKTNPAHGGSSAVLDQRPLDPVVKASCLQNVAILPELCRFFRNKRHYWPPSLITEATSERIRLAQSETYNGQGKHMVLAPWTNMLSSPTSRPTSRTQRLHVEKDHLWPH